MDTQIAGVQ